VPLKFEPLAPDHPLFHGGVGFVFRGLVQADDEHEHDGVDEHDVDEHPAG
jgi:hypothetical protein